jgi:hypothetical protein
MARGVVVVVTFLFGDVGGEERGVAPLWQRWLPNCILKVYLGDNGRSEVPVV